MTRDNERLFLSHAATRRLFGRVYSNLPSRVILESQLAPARRPAPEAAVGAEAAPPAAPRLPLRIRRGLRVKHPEFGLGKIVEKSGSGETTKVTVVFENGKTRKLLVRYAPLVPV